MRVIGIDPGTHCGYAWTDDFKVRGSQCGVWNLTPKWNEGAGARFARFRSFFLRLIDTDEKCLVAFEDVKRHMGTQAAHVYGGIIAGLMEISESRGIEYISFPVGQIKKRATGKGNAKKPDMIASAFDSFGYTEADDNAADALWILQMAIDDINGHNAQTPADFYSS